jgi:acyl dehydratase
MPREEQDIRLDALGTSHPWYREVSPFGRPIFLPTFFLTLYFDVQETKYLIPRMVLAKAELDTLRPCAVDSRFMATLRVKDKYERRGGRYLVTETEFDDEEGERVARLRMTFLLNPAHVYATQSGAS